MRVLSFSSCFPSDADPSSGIFVQRRLAAMAATAQVQVEVVHPVAHFPPLRPARPQQRTCGNLVVHDRPFFYVPGLLKRLDGRFYAAGLGPWLRRHVQSCRPDVLDGHFMWPDGVGVHHLSRMVGVPFAITLRGTILPRYPIACFRKRMIPALKAAGAVISVSRHMADVAVSLGADPARVHVIPNGVDCELFAPAARDQARSRLGLGAGPLVVCVGGLRMTKGQHDLLAAAATLKELTVVLVGGESQAGFRRRLQQQAQAAGMEHRVVFAGPRRPDEVAMYFAAADLSVLPSWTEGCPNVVLESAACGTPVVATSVGGVAENLTEGVSGILCPPRDPAGLAEAIAAGLARCWDRQAIRASVLPRSWASVAAATLEVLAGRS
jgi:glycosyltransferase involved in cell wall biosynthesis